MRHNDKAQLRRTRRQLQRLVRLFLPRRTRRSRRFYKTFIFNWQRRF